jgi:hypothetical protein
MFGWLFGDKQRRSSRHTPGADRAERNAVIKRVVAAAAKRGHKNAEEAAAAQSGAMAPLLATGPLPSAAETTRIPQDRIAERAYEIWIRNGRPTGTQERDWQQAIRELEAEQNPAPRTTVAR